LTSIVSTPVDRPNLKLIYRGCTYDYTPSPVSIVREEQFDAPSRTLIYRGNTYQRRILSPKTYREPRAINWRWQTN
jgi:hypothetical protein